MTDREAFEKWFAEYSKFYDSGWWQCCADVAFNKFTTSDKYIIDKVQIAWNSWQACSQHYEARIKELEDKVKELNTLCNVALSEIEHLDKQALTDKG